VSGHGPDADAIADGERDWTVASATGLFAAGYAAVAVVTHHLATSPATSPSLTRTLFWAVLLCGLVGGTAIAVGSGRAAIWTSFLPISVRAAAAAAWRTLFWYAALSAVVLGVALVVDWDGAVNVMSQLHTSPGAATLLVGLCVLVTPNATLFTGSYLLGPGFAVGTGTLVSPSAVLLGPVPAFPLLAALPAEGTPPPWTDALAAVPVLAGAAAAVLVVRRFPVPELGTGAVRGLGSGVVGGVLTTVLVGLAGGAVGPGRMAHIGAALVPTFVAATVAMGVGGLVGGVGATWWSRRR